MLLFDRYLSESCILWRDFIYNDRFWDVLIWLLPSGKAYKK